MSRKEIRSRAKDLISGHWAVIIITVMLIQFISSAYSGSRINMSRILSGEYYSANDIFWDVAYGSRGLNILGLLTSFVSYVLMGGLHLGIVKLTREGRMTFGDIIDLISEYLQPVAIVAAILTAIDLLFSRIPFISLAVRFGLVVLYPFFFMEIENFDINNLGEFFNSVLQVPGRVRVDLLIHYLYLMVLPLLVYILLSILLFIGMYQGDGFMFSFFMLIALTIGYYIVSIRNGAILEVVRGVEYEYKDMW